MEFICKDFIPSAHTRDLLDAKGREVGVSVEWDVRGGDGLTEREMQALRRKHKTRNVNYQRAGEVKRLMGEGKRCVQIVCALRKKYGERQIKADHAALAALSDRGGRKR